MRTTACLFSLLTIFALGCGDDDGGGASNSDAGGEVAANTGNANGGDSSGGAGMGGDMSEMMGGMSDPGAGGGDGMGMGGPGMGGDMSEMMGGMTDPGAEGGEGMGMGGPGMGDMSEMMGGMTDPGAEGGEGNGLGDYGQMAGMDPGGEGGEGDAMGGYGEMAGMGGFGAGMDPGGEGSGMGDMAGMGGMGDMAGMGGSQGPAPKTLAELANVSYKQGKDKQAIDLIYAAAIADETPDNILARYRWIPGAKRPGLAVRFGLAVNVKTTPRDYKGDAKPIGTEQNLTPGRGNNNGNQGFGDGGFGAGPGGPGGMGDMSGMGDMAGMGGMGMGSQGGGVPEELKKYTGDLGEEIAKALKKRVTEGHFGTVLQVAASKSSSGGGGAMGGMGAGMGGMGAGMGPGMGDPGMGDPGMGDPGMGGGMGMGGGGGSGNVAPGIIMLGEGTVDQILETAVEEDLDAVIYFDVSVAFIPKNGLVRNTTYVSVYDVSSGRQLKKSVPLVNTILQTERKRAKDQKKPDPLSEKVNDFMKTVDMNYKMAKMPQNLTAAVVQQHRLIPLVNSKTISPLKALAEIAFYYRYDLCPEEHRKIAYDSIIGPQMSSQLLAGNFEQRLSAVDVFLDIETSKTLLKAPQAENGGAGSPFGNEGPFPGAEPGAGVGDGAGAESGFVGAGPMGDPAAGTEGGAFPGAGAGDSPMGDPGAAGAFPGANPMGDPGAAGAFPGAM
ncbi:MAG: hypothetical protein CMM03_11520 [Rhodopirellula sp.]|nr:hypothetical protein [Rhodopirellula sp.]